jgi:hypothetical protein
VSDILGGAVLLVGVLAVFKGIYMIHPGIAVLLCGVVLARAGVFMILSR